MSMKTWKQTPQGNFILDKPGSRFYISYNPDTRSGLLQGLFAGDVPEETALCIRRPKEQFLILNGDFRQQYEKCFPSIRNCLAVYEKYEKERNSSWTQK